MRERERTREKYIYRESDREREDYLIAEHAVHYVMLSPVSIRQVRGMRFILAGLVVLQTVCVFIHCHIYVCVSVCVCVCVCVFVCY